MHKESLHGMMMMMMMMTLLVSLVIGLLGAAKTAKSGYLSRPDLGFLGLARLFGAVL